MDKTVGDHEVMVLLPSSVDYKSIEEKGKVTIPNFDINIVKYILHTINMFSIVFNDNYEVVEYKNFTRISSKYWKRGIGKDYAKYTDFLIGEGIVYRVPYDKNKCFGYGFVQPYRYSRIIIEVIRIENIHTFKNKKFKNSYVKKYEKPLADYFDNSKFSIDADKTEEELFLRYFELANFPLKKAHGDPVPSDLKAYTNYLGALRKMVKFMNGNFLFVRDAKSQIDKSTRKKTYKTNGRLYTSFSFLNKEIREKLKFLDELLIEIDIKNCIPYLLSNYLSKLKVRMTKKRVARINESLKDLSSNYMCSETLLAIMDKEIEDFKFLCVEGAIYDQFIEPLKEVYAEKWNELYISNFGKSYVDGYDHDRALAKKLFISMLFARLSQYVEVQDVFRRLFPILFDVLTTIKRKSYKQAAILLFEMEADLMIDKVAKSLMKESKRKIPIFTVHDCIATTKEHLDKVSNKIMEVFYNAFGNVPKISIG